MKSWKKLLSAVLALSLAIPGVAMPTEVQAATVNVAKGKSVTASAAYSTMPASNLTDGNTGSRWSTEAAPTQWAYVDLGSSTEVTGFKMHWESDSVHPSAYKIYVSDSTSNWGDAVVNVTGSSVAVSSHTLDAPVSGRYVKLEVTEMDGYPNVSCSEFLIYGEGEAVEGESANLALGKTASASGVEASSLGADKAVDGDTSSRSSRWSSPEAAGPHWVAVDLGKVETVSSLRIFWETRKATSYRIQISDDGTTYTDAKVIPNRPSDLEDVVVLDNSVNTRYVRLYIDSFTSEDPDGGVTWNTISIFEMEVYSEVYEKPVDPIDLVTAELPESGDKLIVNIPETSDFEIKYNGTDYEQVIGEDLTIYTPIVDTTVKVSFKSTSKTDATDYEFKEIELTVPGLYTQEEGDNAAPAVLPELREWKGYTGNFTVAENAKVVIASEELQPMADAFAADYEDLTGKEMTVEVGTLADTAEGEFFFALTDDTSKGLDEEGYLMEIREKVTVEAEDATGAYWATRTILQALKADDMETIPQGITRDYPLYKVRGYILDVGRKTFTMDFLKDTVKQMSWYKLNDFHVHLNDNYIFLENYTNTGRNPMTAYSGFRLESSIKAGDTVTLNGREFTYQADLTNTDVFYGKDEFRDFIKESNVLGVNIVPEFDAPAHSLSFTKVLPELRTGTNGRENDHLDLATQYDECYDFITNIFDEYLLGENPVFSQDTVIHIGADEYTAAPNKFREFCNDMADYVEATGRTARIWGSLSQIRGDGSVKVDGTGIQMNLWNFGYANMDEMYESGFDLIDCNDGQYYIVPNAGYYGEYLGANVMYNDAPNSISNVTIPAGDKQMIGAAYAIWNDMVDEKDNGISEYDVYKRFVNNMGLFAAKMWGKGSLSMEDAQAIEKVMGDAPNTDFHYEVESDENYVVTDLDGMVFGEIQKNNALAVNEDDVWALQLNGGNSYALTGLNTVGLDHELTVKVKRTSDSTEDQILFESDYGSIKAVQGTTGKVGITRENFNYSFNYELPVGEWVELTIKNAFETVSLYVNGELVDTLGDDETIAERPMVATCMLPVARIGSETNAFEGFVESVVIKAEDPREKADYEGYDLPVDGITLEAGSLEPTEGSLEALLDGKEDTFYHSNWSGTRPTAADFWITMELPEVTEVSGLRYLPRQGSANGRILSYVISYSLDGEEWTEITTGDWADNSSWKRADFGTSVEAKYVKIFATDSKPDDSGRHLTGAELRLVNKVEEETPEEPTPDVPTTPVTNIFEDVADTDWFADEVQYVYDKGIMTGTSETTFEPNLGVTRATIVQTLYKLEGKPAVSDFTKYDSLDDTLDSIWWRNGLAWALNEGVAKGDSKNNVFNPDNEVTREDLATFIYRYAQYKGVDVELERTTDEILGDTFVNSWAKDAFAWAIETGLIKGKTINGVADLAPQVGATRAELATIMMRFYENNDL